MDKTLIFGSIFLGLLLILAIAGIVIFVKGMLDESRYRSTELPEVLGLTIHEEEKEEIPEVWAFNEPDEAAFDDPEAQALFDELSKGKDK